MKTRTETLRQILVSLQKRRDALRKQLRVEANELRTVAHDVGDSIDAAIDAEHQAVYSQLATAETRELARTENALQLFFSGLYGKCETCDVAIPLARLQAIPYATQCVKCQRASEGKPTNRLRHSDWANFENHDAENGEPTAEIM